MTSFKINPCAMLGTVVEKIETFKGFVEIKPNYEAPERGPNDFTWDYILIINNTTYYTIVKAKIRTPQTEIATQPPGAKFVYTKEFNEGYRMRFGHVH
jgi:hypothetical protein